MADETKEISLDVVREFLETHKETDEVKAFTQSLVNKETVETFLGTDDGKKLLQPKLDKNFNKGLETWKQNNLQSIIDMEVQKKFPAETDEQKQLRALQSKLEALEKEKTLATVRAEALKEMGAKGIPADLVDFFVADNLETTRDKINVFEQIFQSTMNEKVATEVKSKLGDTTPRNDGQTGQEGNVTKEALMQMDYSERVKFYTENPTDYQRIMATD